MACAIGFPRRLDPEECIYEGVPRVAGRRMTYRNTRRVAPVSAGNGNSVTTGVDDEVLVADQF